MMTLEKMKGFARTAALRERRSRTSLSAREFEEALNAYVGIGALTNGETPTPVPPLFVHAALAVYRAVSKRHKRAA
ncbi:MAG: hypothetical protein ABR508_07680 [Candidatus Baltobacteraceae bacterium]